MLAQQGRGPQGRARLARQALRATVAGLAIMAYPVHATRAGGLSPAVAQLAAQDAELADVEFVDADHGWAVGARGVVWTTTNGGQTWTLGQTPLEAQLESVAFIDPLRGWAAGRETVPHLDLDLGVLLSTRDGGRTWVRDPGALLPPLRAVRFFDPQHGLLAGQVSHRFASGLWETCDAGQTWAPLPAPPTAGWQAIGLTSPAAGLLVDRQGRAARLAGGIATAASLDGLGLRGVRGAAAPADGPAWLVGDGSLARLSRDGGRTWDEPPTPLASVAGAGFEARAVCCRGPRAWIVGDPGSVVWYTPDAGQSWRRQLTGHATRLNDVAMVDDARGWAVGSLGAILHTTDGGETWRRQHAGGERAALLALFAVPEEVPWELLGKLTGEDGYLATVGLVARRDLEPGLGVDPREERAAAAVATLGGSATVTAWGFPARQAGLRWPATATLDVWNRLHQGRGQEACEEQLVRWIRTWRPEVVLTHDPRTDDRDPLGHMLGQLVLRAVERADNPAEFPDHAERLGLGPWRVRAVFGAMRSDDPRELPLAATQVLPKLGCSLGDVGRTARAVLREPVVDGAASFGLRPLLSRGATAARGDDPFRGLHVAPGGEARRPPLVLPIDAADTLRRAALEQRNLAAVLEEADRSQTDAARLVGQIERLTAELDAARQGDVLYWVGEHLARGGRAELAVEAREYLALRHPTHPNAPAAVRALLCQAASAEAAHRAARAAGINAPAGAAPIPGQLAADTAPAASTLRQLGAPAAAGTTPEGRRLERALALAAHVEARYPALDTDPALGFLRASIDRQAGRPDDAERFYRQAVRARGHDPWSAVAARELWLLDRSGAPPCPVARVAAAVAPRLDGVLDDPAWETATRLELSSPLGDDAAWPATVLLARDPEHLLLAVVAGKPPGELYPPAEQPRRRDAPLDDRDRLELTLDTDREGSLRFRLAVDYRGFGGDALADDATWDPSWYIATAETADAWTVEAAIPLAELTARPLAGEAWTATFQRIAPRAGVQSWTRPARLPPAAHEGGLLVFE